MATSRVVVLISAAFLVLSVILSLCGVNIVSVFESPTPHPESSMSELDLIAKNEIKSATTGETVLMESLWEKQPVVITFFRRWGCILCRVHAQHISAIKEDLDANNVRLIGIGVEDLGKEDFIKGNYFNGELFVDVDKKNYQDLNFKRYNMLTLGPAMLSKSAREGLSESRRLKIDGDLKGDYYQVGGTLVVSAGGAKVLLSQKQESLGDHVNPNKILESLNLPTKDLKVEEAKAECKIDDQSACQ